MKLFTDVVEAENVIAELGGQLGHGNISRAVRMAINDTMRKQRTQLRQYVRKSYNIPGEKVNSINFQPATDFNLEAKMSASHKPVQLAYFKPVFASAATTIRGKYTRKGGFQTKVSRGKKNAGAGVTVEIKKENPITIPYAFMVAKFETPFVFARGQYQKGKGFVRGKPRNPINILLSVSPYGAAFGSDRSQEIEKVASIELEVKAREYLNKLQEGVI